VIADLRLASPDLILHGGDLVLGGSSASGVVDRVQELGWPGVAGNTDELHYRPASLNEFAASLPAHYKPMFDRVAEIADFERDLLGEARIKWLSTLPLVREINDMVLLHASPSSLWKAPQPDVSDEELGRAFEAMLQPVLVYGHVHRAFVRNLPARTIVNSGSVGSPYDGDPRASYVLLGDGGPQIRRVEYDVEREIKAVSASSMPHADWIAQALRTARPA